MSTYLLLAAVLVGVSVFFLFQWVTTTSSLKSMTIVERANAEIADQRRRHARVSLRQRAKNRLRDAGLGENVSLPLGAACLLLLVMVVALSLLGVNGLEALVVAVPLSIAVVVLVASTARGRRVRALNRQLAQALQLLAGQLEGGNGAMAALESVLSSLPDPLQSELTRSLETSGVTADIVETFRGLAQRYPSRSINLVTAAFEINRDEGGQISPAIRQAAETLRRDRELNEETDAEVSQTRSEFWVIVVVIAFVTALMFASQTHSGANPYTNGLSFVVLFLAAANFLFGIYRGLRIFNRAKGTV